MMKVKLLMNLGIETGKGEGFGYLKGEWENKLSKEKGG
jgi:hypothetical protein